MQRRTLRAAGTLALLLAAGGAIAAADGRGLAQLGLEHWNSDHGLEGNWVREVVEGADGMLWIATGSGLSRFDGRVFTAVSGTLVGDASLGPVSALAQGAAGTMWVARDYGGVHQLSADGSRQIAALPALPGQLQVRSMHSDAGGRLWIGSSRGLWRFADASIERVAIETDGTDADVTALVAAPDGALWVRTRDHGLLRFADGVATTVADVSACRGNGFALGPQGERFTSCLDGVWQWDAQQLQWLPISHDRGVGRLFVDRRGDLWFGQREGLSRWSRGTLDVLPVSDGLGDWRVRSFGEDHRGDLWVGTFSGGLARLHRGPVVAVGQPEAVPLEGTSAVLSVADGSVWIGALDQGLWWWHPDTGVGGRWTSKDGLPGATPWALAADPAHPGGIWIGGDTGIAWLQHGRITRRGPGGIAHRDPTTIIYVDPAQADTLWAGGETGGVVELRGGERIVHDARAGFPLQRVRVFHRDRSGRLLAGGDAGLFARQAQDWVALQVDGRTLLGVTAIIDDDDGGLWIASNRDGLVHRGIDRNSIYGRTDGLPFGTIHALERDAYGGLWLSGDEGIARLRLVDHARWERGELDALALERLGRRDGLRDAECNGWGRPASTRLPDGRLVYPTITGIAVLDAAGMAPAPLTPGQIYLRGAWSGNRALALGRTLQLAQDERALRIGFSAIELHRPEAVAFRYRLDGIDAEWVTVKHGTEASWSRMPAGSFVFRLQARVPGHEWIDAPQALAIEVEHQAWESPWLRAAAAALAMLLVGTAFVWRSRVGSRHAQSLARARSLLREVIDTSPNPIFARDRDGAYVLANRAAGEVYGLAPEAIEGRTPEQIGPTPRGMARIDALDAEVIASGKERVAIEDEIIDHHGRRRWFRVVKRPGFGADGRTVEQVIGTAVDVTEFKLAEQRIQREQAKLRRSREEARRLSRRLLRAQEDERQRLAREIHDDLTQQLAGLSMLAWSTVQAAAREPSRDISASLTELACALERIANEVQALSRDLHPPALDTFGLAETVRAECETFGKRTGLAIDFECRGVIADPAPEVGLALYRIVQEALRNCLAHANTQAARVILEGTAGAIRLQIVDAGVGFDPGDASARPGLGLLSMRERAHLAGASLRIDSAIGAGTRLEVVYPAAIDTATDATGI